MERVTRSSSCLTVAIGIPALNAEPYLADAIRSVVKQSYPNWVLTVVDNGSTDRTNEIAHSFADPRITVVRNDSVLPMVDNWNKAMALSAAHIADDHGLMKLLCADDVLDPDCLAHQVTVFDDSPEVVITACRRNVIDRNGELLLQDRGLLNMIGEFDGENAIGRLVSSGRNELGWPGAVMFRRDAFGAVGGFPPEQPTVTDLDLWFRLLAKGDFVGTDEVGAAFRISPTAISAHAVEQAEEHRRLLRQVAKEHPGAVGRVNLMQGLLTTRVESVKRVLLYRSERESSRFLRLVRRFVIGRQTSDRRAADNAETFPGFES